MIRISSPWAEENRTRSTCSAADDAQSARIFAVGKRGVKREFGLSTVAGILVPPYPKGFFKHPAVSEEYFYQTAGNGIGLPDVYCWPNSRGDIQLALTSNWLELPIRR